MITDRDDRVLTDVPFEFVEKVQHLDDKLFEGDQSPTAERRCAPEDLRSEAA